MEENEMLEQTNKTENVETETTEEIMDEGIELTDTTDTEEADVEETPKVNKKLKDLLEENPEYQEEFNEMIKGRLARKDREHQKELSKYKDTDNVLRSTLKIQDGEDVNQKLRESYEAEGVILPSRYEPGLSDREIERLAKGDAEDIIEEGHEAMIEEANRLARKEYKNLNKREKIVFDILAGELTEINNKNALKKIGAKEEILKDKEFIKFKSQFNPNTPIENIYKLYMSSQPKPKVENPGSMKNNDSKSKTLYTQEEISKLTSEELDNEEVWNNVLKSMQQK